MSELGAPPVVRRLGTEPIHRAGAPAGPTLLDFWRWTGSDLLGNALRGTLAEFLVACDVGAASGTRVAWDAYDLLTPPPERYRVEVKSAAYLQSWSQQKLSLISFDIAAKHGWDAATNVVAPERGRASDAYVFALLHHEDKATVDPLDVAQWTFYVLPTSVLDERLPAQKRISLSTLLRLSPAAVRYGEIAPTLNRLLL